MRKQNNRVKQAIIRGVTAPHNEIYGYGEILIWLILVILAGAAICFVSTQNKGYQNVDNAAKESPLDILKRRYAKEELTQDEFYKKKDSEY